MKVELSKSDLINLVLGTSPHYNLFDNLFVKKCGEFTGGHVDRWDWRKYELGKLKDEDLLWLYRACVDSWKVAVPSR